MQKTNKMQGFTLFEILVVIALIAILAVITFVTINPDKKFADARNAIRQSAVNQRSRHHPDCRETAEHGQSVA